MIHIRRILCPTDFSEFSRRALDHAVAIAKWYESTITLLHVSLLVPLPAYRSDASIVPAPLLTPEDRQALLAEMQRFAGAECGPGVPIECVIAEGPIASEILATANAISADLLVMGTHGRSGFERLVLGSVTEKVLRKAACPVLTVPRTAPATVPAPPVLFKRILCAVDFSECSMRALDYAMSLAQRAGAHLIVMNVVELPPDIPREVHETVVAEFRNLQEHVARIENEHRARLNESISDAVRSRCTIETLVAAGTPYREILRVAGEKQAELLVVGIQGRGALDRFFFGSTTQHLVRQATCPVLTLRLG